MKDVKNENRNSKLEDRKAKRREILQRQMNIVSGVEAM